MKPWTRPNFLAFAVSLAFTTAPDRADASAGCAAASIAGESHVDASDGAFVGWVDLVHGDGMLRASSGSLCSRP